ncbi:MAG: aryl-sulfate sulfotransferase, partial [Halobacteriales archaeon]|nr:aryl-sulfate sulfotransferase [Halobacteriales archaeon]
MSKRARNVGISLLILLQSVAACDRQPTGTDDWEPPEIGDLRIVEGPIGLAPTVVLAGVDGGCARAEYRTAGTLDLRVEHCQEDGELAIPLTRLLPASDYDLEVRAVGPEGELGPVHGTTFLTPELPAGLQEMSLDLQTPSVDMLTLMHVRTTSFWGFVILDGDARVVWYWQDTDGAPRPIAKRANGNYAILTQRLPRNDTTAVSRLREITPTGTVVAEFVENAEFQDFHHELIATDEGTLLAVTLDSEIQVDSTTWEGDRIVEWDPETGTIRERWDTFDFYSPAETVGPFSRQTDWGHMNSLHEAADGTLVVGLPAILQVINVSGDFSAIEWELGGSGASVTPDDPFSGTHTATMPSPDHVLVFDNGIARESGEQFSRAIEYQLDIASGTATTAWSFRPSPDLFSRIVSSA